MTRPLKVDIHVHTHHSRDSRASPTDVVRHALELGFDAIAVTDHDTVGGALEAEQAARGTGLIVIPGQEVSASEGEIIALGLRKALPRGMPALETMRQAKKEGGFVVVPHPFDLMRRGIGSSIKACTAYIDAVEVFNARTIFNRFNKKARAFAEESGLPMVAGSDSHFLDEMGKAYLLVSSPREASAVLDAIRSGRTELVIRRQPMASAIRRGLVKIGTYF
jgi:predicted metal-dependent phosphoesterase TrpH